MPRIDSVRELNVNRSTRVKQLEALFDVPAQTRMRLTWEGDFPFDDEPWNVGLIVGASGSGKTSVAQDVFGVPAPFRWTSTQAVIDDFPCEASMQDIGSVCQAVGFNTIPAWMRPFAVLSNGEQFRATIARAMLELPDPIVIDEFTSVVDRQVAKIASHAGQKYIRRQKRKFVAVSCHSDIIDWLQPDWVLEMPTVSFARRALQRRPTIDCELRRVPHASWKLFAPYHYMSRTLHPAARCFGLFVDGCITSFTGIVHRPHPRSRNVKGISRTVTLPDWQGLGLHFVLVNALGAAYKALGYRLHHYPAHPALILNFKKSPLWALLKRPGDYRPVGRTTTMKWNNENHPAGLPDVRPNAIFGYKGPAHDVDTARALLQIPAYQ